MAGRVTRKEMAKLQATNWVLSDLRVDFFFVRRPPRESGAGLDRKNSDLWH